MGRAEPPSSYSSSGYALGPPWFFRGRALYQLHLVKAEIARTFIPKELKLVEAFGYTLGGMFLAHYDDSPAGTFDELVVIAGIVWNPPTSCAWAARVLVNSDEACRHGKKEIGLPSHVASFSKKDVKAAENPIQKQQSLLNMVGMSSIYFKRKDCREVQISEIDDSSQMCICNITIPFSGPESKTSDKWMGPVVRMSLPSFSGQTVYIPDLLKYSCQIDCRVRLVEAARISTPGSTELDKFSAKLKNGNSDMRLSAEDEAREQVISVLLSRPVLALEFNLLTMQVGAPTVIGTKPWPGRNQAADLRT